MIYSLKGRVEAMGNDFLAIEVQGVGYKVFVPQHILQKTPLGSEVHFFCHFYVRETSMELYGFSEESELRFFELLNGVSGIGPKSALAILGSAPIKKLAAAISEGRTTLLVKSFGIGKKTAERIVVELKSKLTAHNSKEAVELMESDNDVYEALKELGYSKSQITVALSNIDSKLTSVNDRLKDALKKIQS